MGGLNVSTDSNGHFEFRNIPAGSYRSGLTLARQRGYFKPLQGGGPDVISVRPGQHIDNLEFRLVPGGSISGRVVDQKARPAVGVPIDVFKLSFMFGQMVSMSTFPGNKPQTNDRGEYSIIDLEPGEYYLRTEFTIMERAYKPDTYFLGTSDQTKAVSVKVEAGKVTSGVDFMRVGQTGNRLLGNIVCPPSADTRSQLASILFIPANGALGSFADFRRGNANRDTGEFEIQNMTPGVYDLLVLSRSFTFPIDPVPYFREIPTNVYNARIRVEMRGSDVEGLSVPLHPA